MKARLAILLLLAALGYLAMINHYQAHVIEQQKQVIRELFVQSGGNIT
jgi:hypothetical protein